ncbi:MAG: DoxX family protein [Verrucomicrobiae bacterium]|nr:DoxX family protein [Verrucomicrobiae bacterium]
MNMTSSIQTVRHFYGIALQWLHPLQDVFLFGIRLYWGFLFFQTGWGKLINHERTAGYFQSLGIPMPGLNAFVAGSTECFGGLLLLLGLASRIISLPLAFTMCIALLTAFGSNIAQSYHSEGFMEALGTLTGADPFPFLMTALIVLLFGPGRISLDAAIGRFCCKQAENKNSKPH